MRISWKSSIAWGLRLPDVKTKIASGGNRLRCRFARIIYDRRDYLLIGGMILRFFYIYISMNKKRLRYALLSLIILSIIVSNRVFQEEKRTEPYTQPQVTLYLNASDKKVAMTLEEYITGTVAAEMPASFEMEALKAQAVCARTYALKRLVDSRKYEKGADLSDDITCCQAYISKGEFSERHPGNSEEYLEKIQQAVSDTRGQIMLYQGEPLDALYCSTCGGKTEGGGPNSPYLKTVSCPYCSSSPRYRNSQTFSVKRLHQALGLQSAGIHLNILSTTVSGRIKELKINDRTVTGEQLRSTLGLPSTWCSFQANGDGLTITSRGYGHGIGLCQFGANGMAKAGYDYQQILHHCYQGFELCRLPY